MSGPVPSDPRRLAAEIAELVRPALVVFDCDGVLAPLVDHADDSVLTDGVRDLLGELAAIDGIEVAILSGRSLDGLRQFDFPDSLIVAGSYGSEHRGRPPVPLTDLETERLADLDLIVSDALEVAGPGAWIERKPASVVLHVREAERGRGRDALSRAADAVRRVVGSASHDGDNVIELMARPDDKGSALARLRSERDPRSVVYIGDDVPDEDAFAALGPTDLGVKVGAGPTIATRRLADPDAVRALLEALVGGPPAI